MRKISVMVNEDDGAWLEAEAKRLDRPVAAAENARQAAIAAATTQTAATSAYKTYYQAVAASTLTNNLPAIYAVCQQELVALGVTGV
jgi:hypothetical protein